jgi:hypothetical protein
VPRKVFVAGEILTAADVNANLMDQAVMVFDDAAARTTAIPSPIEGMVTYLKDTDKLEKYTNAWVDAAPGKILQVVQVVKTDTFSTNTQTYTNITGLSASITPSSASSKILVMAQVTYSGGNNNDAGFFKVVRGSTDIYVGDAAGSRVQTVMGGNDGGETVSHQQGRRLFSEPIIFLDSPATTSSITYNTQTRGAGNGSLFVNRSDIDADNALCGRGVSSITLWEVAG